MERVSKEVEFLNTPKVRKIVDAAKVEFFENGIMSSKLKDIAKRAKIGEATLYRTFEDKVALTKLVALDYWYKMAVQYDGWIESQDDGTFTGLDKMIYFIKVFKVLYKEDRPFLKFLEDFDNYMMSVDAKSNNDGYEKMILMQKDQFYKFADEARKDGSIRPELTSSELYAFISQTVVPTSQKLAMRVGYLYSDEDLDPLKALDNLIDMFRCFCEPKK